MSSILFLDRFFSRDVEDIYYLKKRENTTLISLGCHEPRESCFCICSDCGPFLTHGFDLQLVDLEDKYFVEIGTPKGEKIIGNNKDVFPDVSVEDVRRKQEIVESAKKKFKSARAYFSKTIRKLAEGKIDQAVWEELGQRCFSCGGCSYVCPTCSCFDVVDLPKPNDEHERLRSWDSCLFAGFTKEASGHNPRLEKKERVYRRYYHKLSYDYVEKNEAHGCVGCGRCLVACLGDINMPVVVEKIRRS
jgi:ferredoxin